MRVTYDREVDAAYIYLVDEIAPGGVAKTYPCDPAEVNGMINLDFDEAGRLLGIEVIGASFHLPQELLDIAVPPTISPSSLAALLRRPGGEAFDVRAKGPDGRWFRVSKPYGLPGPSPE